MKRPSRLGATSVAVISVLLFSTGGMFIKGLPLGAASVAGIRSAFAAIFFALILVRDSSPRDWLRMSGLGWFAACMYALMVTSYVFSMKLTTAANAIFLQYTMPAWVLIGGALWLKERATIIRLVTISLCLTGMTLFFMGKLETKDWLGSVIALFSGITFAALTLALRKNRRGRPLHAVLMGNAITAIVLVPPSMIFDSQASSILFSAPVFAGFIWLGVFQIGIAYLCYVTALRYLQAFEVAVIALIEPILNPFWVYLWNGETPSGWAFAGGTIILCSIALQTLSAGKVQTKAQMEPAT